MREVTVRWAERKFAQGIEGKFAQDIEVGGHRIRADEVSEKGGDSSGPGPHELLLAALGSCTAMTLKVYAERKGWPLRDVRVILNGTHTDVGFAIARQLAIDGDLNAEQRQRLIEIADKCPVHKTLVGDIAINTTEEVST